MLLKNPPFLFLCLAGATEATLIAGMSTFGPKFLESQFNLSASEAATWFGERTIDRQTDRHTDQQTERHTYREEDKKTDRDTDRKTDKC
jgi:hypothetical protein